MLKINYKTKKKIVILISGRGSNMQAIVNFCKNNKLPVEICSVISNNPSAEGIKFAISEGINTTIINNKDYISRDDFDEELLKEIDKIYPDYIILAGFMRILTEKFVNRYYGRLINIHPSLLPLFPGLDTHRKALSSGICFHGCTVHFVTKLLDNGPIIAQGIVPIKRNDTVNSLASRLLKIEHIVFTHAIEWLINDLIILENNNLIVRKIDSRLFILNDIEA